MDNRPIGVFDSGLGGLTVVKEMIEHLPNENIIYFGDTARIPYGSRSGEMVTKYSAQCIRFLRSRNIKMVVIACNTASSSSLVQLKGMFPDIPIIGVIEPGAKSAVLVTKNKKIGVIGTSATIRSRAYVNEIRKLDPAIKVYDTACPLFVHIVEEGWSDTDIAYLSAARYLEPIKSAGVDTLVLGCTHYPLLKDTITKYMGSGVSLVNPAVSTVRQVSSILNKTGLAREEEGGGSLNFFVSDFGQKFKDIGSRFLNKDITTAEKIDIENY